MDVEELRRRARVWPKGHAYEDFEADQVFEHHWGRTLFHSECALFATNTHQHNPLYFNQADWATSCAACRKVFGCTPG